MQGPSLKLPRRCHLPLLLTLSTAFLFCHRICTYVQIIMNQDAIGYSWLFLESARTRVHIYMQHLQTFVETTDYASLHYCSCKGLEILLAKLRGAAPSLCTVQSDYSSISSSLKMYHEIVLHSRSQQIPCPKLLECPHKGTERAHPKASTFNKKIPAKNSSLIKELVKCNL
jgi:hypothetical protein